METHLIVTTLPASSPPIPCPHICACTLHGDRTYLRNPKRAAVSGSSSRSSMLVHWLNTMTLSLRGPFPPPGGPPGPAAPPPPLLPGGCWAGKGGPRGLNILAILELTLLR
eukprot:1139111-Pelagomonas_calceolata.AAC.4